MCPDPPPNTGQQVAQMTPIAAVCRAKLLPQVTCNFDDHPSLKGAISDGPRTADHFTRYISGTHSFPVSEPEPRGEDGKQDCSGYRSITPPTVLSASPLRRELGGQGRGEHMQVICIQ